MLNTQIYSTFDSNASGKQQGFLQVPYSYNLAGWANLLVPITVVSGAGCTFIRPIGSRASTPIKPCWSMKSSAPASNSSFSIMRWARAPKTICCCKCKA